MVHPSYSFSKASCIELVPVREYSAPIASGLSNLSKSGFYETPPILVVWNQLVLMKLTGRKESAGSLEVRMGATAWL